METFNKMNSKYYSTNSGAFTDHGVADVLVANEPLQRALLKYIESKTRDSEVKLLELASGKRLNRWQTIAKHLGSEAHKIWDVTLSDFTEKALPSDHEIAKINSEYLKIKTHSKNVDISKNLPEDPKLNNNFEFVLTSYGFDSVWAKEDARFEKIGKGVFKNFESTDLSKEPFGGYISAFFNMQDKDTAINFAGGMLARIDELFSLYLKNYGAFISLDITELTNDHLFSGGAAFKPENYKVLVPILNDKGYKTELYNLNDFIEKMGESTPIDLGDHSLLFVTKA